jgi:hypothetical protein
VHFPGRQYFYRFKCCCKIWARSEVVYQNSRVQKDVASRACPYDYEAHCCQMGKLKVQLLYHVLLFPR